MGQPLTVDIPHKLGRDGAKARLAGSIGTLADRIPGGAAVEHRWNGDTMHFTVRAMGQTVASKLDVFDDRVRAEIDLPPFLALFADKIREKIARDGPKLLT